MWHLVPGVLNVPASVQWHGRVVGVQLGCGHRHRPRAARPAHREWSELDHVLLGANSSAAVGAPAVRQ